MVVTINQLQSFVKKLNVKKSRKIKKKITENQEENQEGPDLSHRRCGGSCHRDRDLVDFRDSPV